MRLRILLSMILLGWNVTIAHAFETATVALTWTTPGDDDFVGIATDYDLRYSTEPLSESNFHKGTRPSYVPTPGLPGSFQSCTIIGLDPTQSYYFAVKTSDERGNWSRISNLAFYSGRSVRVEATALGPTLALVGPNPASGRTQFLMTLNQPENVRIEAFDATGRRVKTIATGVYEAGIAPIIFDFTGEGGNALGPGLFFVRAQIGKKVFTRRVIARP
jgi:hypothetical protein